MPYDRIGQFLNDARWNETDRPRSAAEILQGVYGRNGLQTGVTFGERTA